MNVKRVPEGKMYTMTRIWSQQNECEVGRNLQSPKASGSEIQATDRSRAIQESKPGDLKLVPSPYFNDTTYSGEALSVSKPFLHTVPPLVFKSSLHELSGATITFPFDSLADNVLEMQVTCSVSRD